MQQSHVLLEPLARLINQPGAVVLVALLVMAAVIDWRTYRIPNWLTAGGMAFGLIYNSVIAQPWHEGLLGALAGLGVGLVVLLPVYALRVMGAGDVKLMAMVGAIVGLPDILHAVLYSLVVGGIAAIGFALHRRVFRRMGANAFDIVQSMAFAAMVGNRPTPALSGRASIGKLPYGVSIAGGTIAWLAARLLGLA
ncbi:MAG: A24 family peptidase [Burkholderiales bacterium]|nr:A24 family peptidase [Burkholderiales bacterium]